MERATKVVMMMVMLNIFLVVQGGRVLKDEGKMEHPQNYFGAFGGSGSVVPTPFGPAISLGPSAYCSNFPGPGVGCVRVVPGTGAGTVTVPGGGTGTVPPGAGTGTGTGVGSPP